jgi:hypothetical protein
MKKSQQTYSENKTHTQNESQKKRERERFSMKKKQSIVITKQRMLLIKVSNRMYCT